MKAVHVVVSGRVQGVFFRESTKRLADKLGIKGYVMNLPSGEVEIVAWGSESAVNSLIEWCHSGPPLARVDNVVVKEASPGDFPGFEIKY